MTAFREKFRSKCKPLERVVRKDLPVTQAPAAIAEVAAAPGAVGKGIGVEVAAEGDGPAKGRQAAAAGVAHADKAEEEVWVDRSAE